ncbi:MAG: PilX N-terminal domain-containing pilus assembly protein [Bacillota bacterium]|uniref:PilX N-terminal domain-containing pilus assembly protein n=1 Tax=Desulforudis sp. DRI-14 TaxID=3459793 RepID=UPI00347FCEBE
MTGERKGIFKSRQVRRKLLGFLQNTHVGTQKGAALVTVVLLTLVLLVFAGSLVQLAAVDKRVAASQVAMTQALYLAEAGAEMTVARLAVDFGAVPPSTPIVLGNGQIAKITVSPVDATTKEILAEGRAGNARKALKVRVQRTAAPVLQNAVCSGNNLGLSSSVSITGNLLVNGDLDVKSGVSIADAGRLVVKGNLTNRSGTNKSNKKNEGINIAPGGSLLVGGDLDNRHGRIETPGYLQADGSIDNSSGTVVFSPGGTYYTPSTEYPAGTFIIQDDGQVPRLDSPRENIAALVEPAARLNPAGKVAAYQSYPRLDVTERGNRYESNLTGRAAGTYYFDTGGNELRLEGEYSGEWVIAVKGDVEISGNLLPANASQDVLVLLVDGTVSVHRNEDISAVIYAGRFEAGGGSTVRGTVAAQSFDVSGDASLIQDDDLIRNAVQISTLPPDMFSVKIISWREEYDVF